MVFQWRELRWSCLRSCPWRPPGGVRRSQQKKIRLLSALILKEGILKAPANTERHLPESSELQVRYFQCTTRGTVSPKHLPCLEKASLPRPCQSSQHFLLPTPGSLSPRHLCFMSRVTVDLSLTRVVLIDFQSSGIIINSTPFHSQKDPI